MIREEVSSSVADDFALFLNLVVWCFQQYGFFKQFQLATEKNSKSLDFVDLSDQ